MENNNKHWIKEALFTIAEFLVVALLALTAFYYFKRFAFDAELLLHIGGVVLLSYLFYKSDITSILFGKSSKFADFVIVFSYFSMFFIKDISVFAESYQSKFQFIKLINDIYLFLQDNSMLSLYAGIFGLLITSCYITKRMEISSPSFLNAVYSKRINNGILRFLLIFVSLLGFYFFVYNLGVEWIELVINKPAIIAAAAFYFYRVIKHSTKFSKKDFIFRIFELKEKWYEKFISLFHDKRTLALAISGLLVLHLLTDLGVFAYSFTLLKENIYLEYLTNQKEHTPFLKLFLHDKELVSDYAIAPLFIDYLLNDLSLIILLLIPIIVWAQMFSQKEWHLNRIFLFFIYAPITAYLLLPAYTIKPLVEYSIKGVDITTNSILSSNLILDKILAVNREMLIAAVPLISLIIGLTVYALSSNDKFKRKFYSIAVASSLIFYLIYIYYFFTSSFTYFYDYILLTLPSRHFLIGITLLIFLMLSIIFYVLGYLMFVYEIILGKNRFFKRKV